jgi:hypothetical protein
MPDDFTLQGGWRVLPLNGLIRLSVNQCTTLLTTIGSNFVLGGGGGLIIGGGASAPQPPPQLLWPCSLTALFHHAMTSYFVSIYTLLLNRQNVVNFPSILFCNQFKFQKFAFQNGHLLAEKVFMGVPQLKNIGLIGYLITLELSREI